MAHKQGDPRPFGTTHADSHLPHHLSIRRMSRADHALFEPGLQHFSLPAPRQDTQFCGLQPAVALCLVKQQNYFFPLHPKLCLQDLTLYQGTEARFSFTPQEHTHHRVILPNLALRVASGFQDTRAHRTLTRGLYAKPQVGNPKWGQKTHFPQPIKPQ